MLQGAQTPFQMIRHPKLHANTCKKRPDWTIFMDFRHFQVRLDFHENRENRDMHLFYFQFQFEHLSLLLDA